MGNAMSREGQDLRFMHDASQMPWGRRMAGAHAIEATAEEFSAGRIRRFGKQNPELMQVPFWLAMVRSEANAWAAREQFKADEDPSEATPIWSFQRYRQTHTLVANRWVFSVGGAHEMAGDPDFMIYNDVVVRDLNGGIWIYGYLKDDFPPVDGHTATLLADYTLLIIGGIGYQDDWQPLETPVYSLDLATMEIHQVETHGPTPGQIFEHSVTVQPDGKLLVSGGRIKSEEDVIDNTSTFLFNSATGEWSQPQ